MLHISVAYISGDVLATMQLEPTHTVAGALPHRHLAHGGLLVEAFGTWCSKNLRVAATRVQAGRETSGDYSGTTTRRIYRLQYKSQFKYSLKTHWGPFLYETKP